MSDSGSIIGLVIAVISLTGVGIYYIVKPNKENEDIDRDARLIASGGTYNFNGGGRFSQKQLGGNKTKNNRKYTYKTKKSHSYKAK